MNYYDSKEYLLDLEVAQEADLNAKDMEIFLTECKNNYDLYNQESPAEYAGMTPEEATEEFFTKYFH